MKKCLATSWLISLALFFQIPIFAQTTEQTLEIANTLVDQLNYPQAIYYYQRAYFFGNPAQQFTIAQKIARLYSFTNKYQEASDYYDIAATIAPEDSSKWEMQLEKVAVLLSAKSPEEAYIELLSMPDSFPNPFWQKRYLYFLGVTQMALGNWTDAEASFVQIATNSSNKSKIHALFVHRKHKNIKTARVLSAIIPGAGQLYAHDAKGALNSILLTGSIATMGVESGIAYGWSGSLWTINWFTRYYRGGIRAAGWAAEERNRHYHYKLLQELNELLK